MKKNKNNIYKCKITYNDDNTISIISFVNQQIPFALFDELNKAVHNVRETYNGENSWKDFYIHFEHEGHSYKQINSPIVNCCKNCVFENKNSLRCEHPHYMDGTKGVCNNKIYIEYDKKCEF